MEKSQAMEFINLKTAANMKETSKKIQGTEKACSILKKWRLLEHGLKAKCFRL